MPADDDLAARLDRLVVGLGCPAGRERSVRLVPGGLHPRRYLLTLATADLGPDAARVLGVADALGMPAADREAARVGLPGARFVHFGYEADPAAERVKLYLEWPKPAEIGTRPVPLYVGYKWTPGRPGPAVATRYAWLPGLTADEVAGRVTAASAGAVRELTLDAVRLAAGRVPGHAIRYLEVTEEAGRRSFVINLYRAGLRVADLGPALAACGGRLGVPPADLWAFVEAAGPLALGHVAAGAHRDGRAFATVYYGREDYVGPAADPPFLPRQ